VLLALITDPFRIFHQLFFRLLSSSQFPRILIIVEYAPSSWTAPPLQTPLPQLATTVSEKKKNIKSVTNTRNYVPVLTPSTSTH